MKPKMILFDYGGTLLYEGSISPRGANEAVFELIRSNPRGVTVEEFTDTIEREFFAARDKSGGRIEIHEHIFLRYMLDYFGMELSVSIEEAEWAAFNGLSQPVMTPGADTMLAELDKTGIRTGIVSNLCWSGKALSRRIRETFPGHEFEFIMTSSEYIYRKPCGEIFETAVRKSGLPKSDIWYCGNSMEFDCAGAHNAGIFPVLYDNRDIVNLERVRNDDHAADFPFLRIGGWDELTDKLRGM